MARHLLDRGFQPGERVAIHWQNSIEFVVLMLGTWRAGLIEVPINPRLKVAEIATSWNTPEHDSASVSRYSLHW